MAATILPAYKIIFEGETSYTTSMAAGVTLEEAQKYFIGRTINPDMSKDDDEGGKVVASVERLTE